MTTPANGSYKAGDNLDFTVSFTEAVNTNLPIDRVSGAAAAYGLRTLKSNYVGSAIRVRRSSDNTEQDMGFANGGMDTQGLINFVGAENLLGYSEQMDNWDASSAVVTPNVTTAPDGTNTADKLIGNNGVTGRKAIYQNYTVTNGTQYTFSVYLKAGETTTANIWFDTASSTPAPWMGAGTALNLATGTSANPSAVTMTPVGNGWFRCVSTATTTITAAIHFSISQGEVNGGDITGDGVSGIYVWGGQLNTGASANTYCRTDSALTANGNGFITTWYDQSGNGRNATQATVAKQPQIVSAGTLVTMNGKPAMQYDGSNDSMSSGSFAISQPITRIFAGEMTALSGNNHLLNSYNGTPNTALWMSSSGTLSMYAGSTR